MVPAGDSIVVIAMQVKEIAGGIAMKSRLVLIAALSGLLLYGGAAATASAATHHHAAWKHGASSSTGAENCVGEAEPDGSMVTPTATCYATFSAAIRAATGGRVILPATAKPGSVTPAMIDAWNAGPAVMFVLSIDYKDANFAWRLIYLDSDLGLRQVPDREHAERMERCRLIASSRARTARTRSTRTPTSAGRGSTSRRTPRDPGSAISTT